MKKKQANSEWLLMSCTFIIAFLLTILPLPSIAQWFRPEWVALVLIYWVLTAPDLIGMRTAFLIGLVLDGLRGGLLGQYALVFTLMTFIVLKSHRRLNLFPLWQQAVCVFFIIAGGQLVVAWTRGLIGQSPISGGLFWLAALTSMILWPWLYLLMSDYRRRCYER